MNKVIIVRRNSCAYADSTVDAVFTTFDKMRAAYPGAAFRGEPSSEYGEFSFESIHYEYSAVLVDPGV